MNKRKVNKGDKYGNKKLERNKRFCLWKERF